MRQWLAGSVALCVALALTAGPARAANTAAANRKYFYLVTKCDGSVALKELTRRAAGELEKTLREERTAAAKEWTEARAKWSKTVAAAAFPVPVPKSPKLQRLGRVPSDQRQRDRDEKRYARRLAAWDVVVVRDAAGTRTAEALRRDKVAGRQAELLKDYAVAMMNWAAENKGKNPAEVAKTDKNVPRKPTLVAVKRGLTSRKLADRVAGQVAKRLEAQKKPDPADAKPEPEQKPEPAQPEDDAPKDAPVDL
jgi:hypothetical protein